MKKLLFVLGLLGVTTYSYAGGTSTPTPVLVPTSVIISSASGNGGGQAQILVTTPTASGAYSTGFYTYLTNVHIEMYPMATAIGPGGGSPIYCTSAGIPNTPKWGFSAVTSSGVVTTMDMKFTSPTQGTQASNVTITCPATTNVLWNIIVGYFQAS